MKKLAGFWRRNGVILRGLLVAIAGIVVISFALNIPLFNAATLFAGLFMIVLALLCAGMWICQRD